MKIFIIIKMAELVEHNKLAFIIPIHPKHYYYIYNLNKKIDIIQKVCDVFLIFSSKTDYDSFKCKENFKHIIIPADIRTNSIVTYKKFYALETLKDKYSYYIVCDAEIDIINENFTFDNVMTKINLIYENKIVYAGLVSNNKLANTIVNNSSNVFVNSDDVNKLQALTLDYNLYYWWSDLPIYKGSDLEDFFSKINYNNINWHHFDHIIYLNYLILYHNFKFINVTPLLNISWSLESLHTTIEKLEILKTLNYSFSWISPRLYRMHKDYLTENGAFLIYHLDR